MRCDEIIAVLNHYFPENKAENWDNPGLQLGRRDREVKRIFFALDATDENVEAAIAFGADMLITHHPLIFSKLAKINDDSFIGRRLLLMAENRISYYAMHTNFDIFGMAGMNAGQLELEYVQPLEITGEEEDASYGLGCIGTLKEAMPLHVYAPLVRTQLQTESVRVYGMEQDPMIHRVAVCSGSGKSLIDQALAQDADVMITGDLDYHTSIDAVANGLAMIDAGHYGTEYQFVDYMLEKSREWFPDIEVSGADYKEPFVTISKR